MNRDRWVGTFPDPDESGQVGRDFQRRPAASERQERRADTRYRSREKGKTAELFDRIDGIFKIKVTATTGSDRTGG